jgi:hypothetical protein
VASSSYAQVLQRICGKGHHELRHAVDEGLDPNEAHIRPAARFVQNMLAASETDLQPYRRHLSGKQRSNIAGRFQRQIDAMQRQLLGQRIGVLSALTRSVFSQEKEPSRPGLRPKWP